MHLQGELHALPVEHVQNRIPAVGEVLVAGLDHPLYRRRKPGQRVPDAGAGEPRHGGDPELRGRPGRVLHRFGGPLAHPFRIAVPPDVRSHDALVAGVDRRIAHALADQVIADDVALQAVAREQLALGGDVAGIGQRLVDLEVISPARQLQAVEAPGLRLPAQFRERQIRPLAGEQGYLSCHAYTSSLVHFWALAELATQAAMKAMPRTPSCTVGKSRCSGAGCSPASRACSASA